MDPAGRPAFTVRRKRLSLSAEQWLIFAGGEEEARRPVYAVKRGGGSGGKSMACVAPCAGGVPFEVEGSYGRRSCVVYDDERGVTPPAEWTVWREQSREKAAEEEELTRERESGDFLVEGEGEKVRW
ncbi:hypothetical protein HU200_048613 [Digitaria exilis]|uniref:Uncharacterized protein n=1 Tax=Digitaria exilis TaxID=1010633 RepID=A0A835AW39_9POAL|nr:hypothetical protein HU200_048613 [Digitaria exilis]